MRRIFAVFLLFCFACGLFVCAEAASAAEHMQSSATISANGSCQITLTVALHLDQPADSITFPLPENAANITLNGKRVRGRLENGLRYVDLSGIVGKTAGNFTLTLTYSLSKLITTNKADQPELQLPLLSGFAFPIQTLDFSVTLPGQVETKPAFTSGYHQANIEKDLSVTVSGTTITGQALTELKDHETLVLILPEPPGITAAIRNPVGDSQKLMLAALVFFLLAVAYWLISLRNLPRWPRIRPTPPDGFDAGALGSVLFLRGIDLNMMVLSWAQSGYLLIHLSRNGRVILYRQMDMGNERSDLEQRYFRLLFGGRTSVDAGTMRYAALCHKAEHTRPDLSSLVHPKSGNITVFRALGGAVGALMGAIIGLHISSGAALQWLPAILLGGLALLCCWHIQGWALSMISPGKRRLWLAVALCAGWLALGYGAGNPLSGWLLILSQLAVGALAALGGRRTAEGRQAQGEVLGLWRYLRSVSPEQLRQICQYNPEYYHQMAAYAIALGVHGRFAHRFGKLEIPPCPYFTEVPQNTLYAHQWYDIMHRVLSGMKPRQGSGLAAMIRKLLK